MSGGTTGRALVAVVLVGCLLAVLAGQALTDASAPQDIGRDAGRSMGRASSAFLEGLRVFAAALVWNRLEPQLHEYYEQRGISEMTWLVPNLRLVVLLDPQFVQAYYVLPWILGRNGRGSDAVALAREGVANNPRSGILWASYAQVLQVFARDPEAAVKAADRATDDRAVWGDPRLEWDGLQIAIAVYKAADRGDDAARATARATEVDREIHERGLDRAGGHDHGHEDQDEEGPFR